MANTDDRLRVSLRNATPLNIALQGGGSAGTRNYEALYNQPRINDVILIGNRTLADLKIVSENTSEGWQENRLYVPKLGEICIFSDTHAIKIGDGSVAIADLPFIGGEDASGLMDLLQGHINNTVIHVTQQDRDFWDAKLNYMMTGEELIFTRQ